MVRVSVFASVQKDKRPDTDVQIRTKHHTHTRIYGWMSIYNRHTTEALNSIQILTITVTFYFI